MYQIENLTSNARQKQTLVLPDGTQIVISLYFMASQFGWFINSITYANTEFELHGMRICNSPNLLHQYRNKIPFGLYCVTEGGYREPSHQKDLSSGATKLFILTPAEVQAYVDLLSG